MYCIVSPSHDPFFNLAAEEYLFRNVDEDLLFLYSNEPSVVVGKHQNAMAEISPVYVEKKGIKVIRRMTGGGAVYHDKGNLNFSFHTTVADTSKVKFSDLSKPVVEALNSFGIPAEFNTRNDIVVNGYKVSGHAQHVFRNRIVSHGTLLIDSDLEMLSMALRKSEGTYEGKAIQSVRSRVINLSTFTSPPLTVQVFIPTLLKHITAKVPESVTIGLSSREIEKIDELSVQKYSTWEWNFGYSPGYRFLNRIENEKGYLSCILSVEKGIMIDVQITGTLAGSQETEDWVASLTGQRHCVETVEGINEFLLSLLF